MKPDIVVGTRAQLAQRFLEDLEGEFRARASHSRFILAVPGGSVADVFFPALAAASLPWKDIDVCWTDERAVPPTSAESNYRQAARLWLDPARVPRVRIHRMPAELPDLAEAAAIYTATLAEVAGSPPRLDYTVLGVGDDGHVASLFQDNLDESAVLPVTWTDRAPKPPPRRMTLSIATLAASRRIVVAAFDPSKAEAIDAALHVRSNVSPLGVLLRDTTRTLLLLTPDIELQKGAPDES